MLAATAVVAVSASLGWSFDSAAAQGAPNRGAKLEEAPQPPSFRLEVLPLLERAACASAACHGGATGRGGFKLSLFGSDPASDWHAIAEEQLGRRIDVADPERSLLLRKATKRYEHGGGRIFRKSDEAYRVLHAWILAGAPSDVTSAPRVQALRLELEGERVRAFARFAGKKSGDPSDASSKARSGERPVDAYVRYWSSDPAALRIDPDGRVERLAPGQHWVFARYAGASARLRFVVPYARPGTARGERPKGRSDEAARGKASAQVVASRVDTAIDTALERLGLRPGPRAHAHVLQRRASLYLRGRPPQVSTRASDEGESERQFAADCARHFESSDFERVLEEMVVELLELDPVHGKNDVDRRQLARLRVRVREHVSRDCVLDDVADLLLGRGGEMREVLLRHDDARDRAEFFGRSLLGLRLGCARCHDHPSDRWRRDEHLGFAALFVDRRRGSGKLYDDRGDPVPPRVLTFAPPKARDVVSESGASTELLRRLLRGEAGRVCARAWCHRVFAKLFGQALYEPVDDQRLTNPAVHEDVLAILADDMLAHGSMLRRPFEVLVRTAAYARASADEAEYAKELRYFARRRVRSLDARQRLRVAAAVLGLDGRELQAAAAPLRAELELRRGAQLRGLLAREGNALELLLLTTAPEERVPALFRMILAREASARERERFGGIRVERDLRDLARALLSCREFSVFR